MSTSQLLEPVNRLSHMAKGTLQIRKLRWLWPVWLSELNASLQTNRLLVRFPVRAHAWVAGQAPVAGLQEATYQCLSHTWMFLSLFLPSVLLSKNK